VLTDRYITRRLRHCLVSRAFGGVPAMADRAVGDCDAGAEMAQAILLTSKSGGS
jgi:hypothetical protein